MSNFPPRPFRVEKLVFDSLTKYGSKSVIFGGAATAMNGSTRQTRV